MCWSSAWGAAADSQVDSAADSGDPADSGEDADTGEAAATGFDFDGAWHPASERLPCESALLGAYADDYETAAGAYFGDRMAPGEFTVSAFNLEAPGTFEPGTVAMLFYYLEQEPLWGSAGTAGTLTVSDDGSGGLDVKWLGVELRTKAGDTGISREGWLTCGM